MVKHKPHQHLYEFGPFRLDASQRLLTCEGKTIPLAPKLLDTLLVLVENNGRLLPKEELLNVLWPDSYVEESNLTTYVSQLRKALGENGEGENYIETVPRRGYRFRANVTTPAGPEAELVIHERTNTHIIVEEEITDTDNRLALIEASPQGLNHLASSRLANYYTRLSLLQRTLGVAIIASCSIAIVIVGFYLWYQRATSKPSEPFPFQRMQITKLTASGKIPLAAISPDGKYAAHVVQDNSLQSLWTRQTSTTSNVQIVPPAAVKYLSPAYSPDGTFIYYVTYEANGMIGTLYQVPALGGTPRKILKDVDSPVTFSPDGKRLAFIRHYPQTRESSLILTDIDGQNETRLITRKAEFNFSFDGNTHYAPSWSPDGKIIACAVINDEGDKRLYNLIGVDVHSGEAKTITTRQWQWIGQVAWLPGNKGLVANAWDQGSSTVSDQIWHITYPSGQAHRITNDINSYKGLSVATKTGSIITVLAAQMSRLMILSPAQNLEDPPITAGFSENYSEYLGLAWTQDNRIVYGSNASGNADIWIMDRDGKNQRQLTTSLEKDLAPVVSPDNRYIVYINFQGRTPHIMRMDLDGNNPRQLTNGQGEIYPTISSDGKWVAYSGYDGQKQTICKVSIDGGQPQPITGDNFVKGEYSPDGKWLATIQQQPDSGLRKIMILPAEGGNPIKVFENLPYQRWGYLKWLSDSSALTLAGTINGVSNIYKYSLNADEPQQITAFNSDFIFRYAWSRDGNTLALERGMPLNDIIMITESNNE